MNHRWLPLTTAVLLLFSTTAAADEPPHECGWLFPDHAGGDTLLEVPVGYGVGVTGDFSGGWNCPEDHGWGLNIVATNPEGIPHYGELRFLGDRWRPSSFVWTPHDELEAGITYTMGIEHTYTYPDGRIPPETFHSSLRFVFVDEPIELPNATVDIWAELEVAVTGCCSEAEVAAGTCRSSYCDLTTSATMTAVIDPVPPGLAPHVGWRLHYASDLTTYQLAQGDASTEPLTIERTIDGEGPFTPHSVQLELFAHGDSEAIETYTARAEADVMGDECSYVNIPTCEGDVEDPVSDPEEPHVDPEGPDDEPRANPDDESIFDDTDAHASGRARNSCSFSSRPTGWRILLRR